MGNTYQFTHLGSHIIHHSDQLENNSSNNNNNKFVEIYRIVFRGCWRQIFYRRYRESYNLAAFRAFHGPNYHRTVATTDSHWNFNNSSAQIRIILMLQCLFWMHRVCIIIIIITVNVYSLRLYGIFEGVLIYSAWISLIHCTITSPSPPTFLFRRRNARSIAEFIISGAENFKLFESW